MGRGAVVSRRSPEIWDQRIPCVEVRPG